MTIPVPSDTSAVASPAIPDAAALALRAVHRAASELRRGTPVLLRGGEQPLVVAAAEAVGARGLAELAAAARTPPVLLLAPARAAAVAPTPALRPVQGAEASAVALRLPPGLLDPAALRSLADPTAERLLPEGTRPERVPVPAGAAAALALAKLGRLLPALVAAPAREGPGLLRQDLLSVEAAQVLAYPATAATSLRKVAEAAVPLEAAPDARIVAFRAADGGIEHLAILVGRPEAQEAPLARMHSECFTGDLLGSLRCDCGPQLQGAIGRMAAEGAGVLLYLAQEGRGIGLVNKLRAYALQDAGLDTLDANRALGWGADERNFLVAATMLRQLGIGRVRLLTNNPEKLAALAACGIAVEGRVAHAFAPNGVNDGYLETKARRFGHLLA
ncbi:GTP cyclohydrolase II [Paracraurococcus lichenis]|uniref:GTP cyclohydrolase-2 n=1 Tax=Paracraurococcus lichenis TaxID=3064888 RepID=A0ABT9E3X9_9PROT|nr:GTP cyclohydrolase II [Paracraurococcus sp. LOR1-02]MDO9710857.1 GTP cyclohydrolase II [Paracraurococcus sp. LOR1-02]